MTEQQFKNKMNYARAMHDNSDDQRYWAGYIRGLRRYYHGEKFGTEEEHIKYISLADEARYESRQRMGQGYVDALSDCQRSDAASALGQKGGQATTERKRAAGVENMAKARAARKQVGWPKGKPRKIDD